MCVFVCFLLRRINLKKGSSIKLSGIASLARCTLQKIIREHKATGHTPSCVIEKRASKIVTTSILQTIYTVIVFLGITHTIQRSHFRIIIVNRAPERNAQIVVGRMLLIRWSTI